jgi:hypothetical protein
MSKGPLQIKVKEVSKKDIILREERTKPSLQFIRMKKPFKDLTKETIGNETAQALIRIFETENKILKVFWIICLVVCGTLSFYFLIQSLFTYLSFPVYTTTTIVHEMPTAFPKITICNTMPAITEYAYELINEINNDYSPDISIFNQSQMSDLIYLNYTNFFFSVWYIFLARISSGTFSDTSRQKLAHPFDDVLQECLFNGQECSWSDFKWQWDPLYGNCYVFNSGYNASGISMDYKESLLPGLNFGLSLVLYVGYTDKLNLFNAGFNSFVPFTSSCGLNLIIENNTYLTNHKNNIIALNGGTINYMSMQRKFYSKLPKPYSDCDIDNKNPGRIDSPYYNLILNSPYQYTQEMCVIQCLQKQVIEMCNCSIAIYLDLYNVSCKNNNQSNCAMGTLYDGSLNKTIRGCILKCPLECNTTEFAFSTSFQTSSGIGYANLIKSKPKLTSDFSSTPINEYTASNKFVQLNIYYDSLSYTMSTDSPSMDIVAFLGSIGGTLGLFLGVSVLSVCELMHVLVEGSIIVKNSLRKT